jgi:hypothetical protein
VIVELVGVGAIYVACDTWHMVSLEMSVPISHCGITPLTDEMVLGIAEVFLLGVFIPKVAVALCAIMVRVRMDHVGLVMLEQPEGSLTRVTIKPRHDARRLC